MNFQLEIKGDAELLAAFGAVEDKLSDLRDFWPAVADKFFDIEKRLFASEGGTGKSGRWAPLSPAYAEAKRKAGYGDSILQREGALYNALTRKGAAGQIYEERADTLTVGTTHRAARHHFKGTKKMPARPPVDLTDRDAAEMSEALVKPLAEYARRQGFGVSVR